MIKDLTARMNELVIAPESVDFSERALDIVGRFPALIVAAGKNPDYAIDEALAKVGMLFSASRVYVMLDEKEGRYLRNTHEWVNQKTGSVMFSWPLYDYEYDVPSLRTLVRESDVYFSHTRDLPEDLARVLSKQGVYTFAFAPIFMDGSRVGLVGMDFCNGEIAFSPNYGTMLRYLAGFVALALERKHFYAMRRKLCMMRDTLSELGPFLDASKFDEESHASRPSKPTTLLDAERKIIIETLELYNGNKLKTAKHLGLTWPSLDRRCKKLGIEAKRK